MSENTEKKGKLTPVENVMSEPSEFMKETIKQRPLNRRKLLRKTIITASMAVIFGLIACLTFLLLTPIINNTLYPEEQPEKIKLEETVVEEEMLPEDMFEDDTQMFYYDAPEQSVLDDEQLEQVLSELGEDLDIEDYISLNNAVNSLIRQVQHSLVTVVGTTADKDWFDNEYKSENGISGAVVADNGKELLIVGDFRAIMNADSLEAVFYTGQSYACDLKQYDNQTGLAVIAVSKSILPTAVVDHALPLPLGNTSSSTVVGKPVIALGSPMGILGSVDVGMITANSYAIEMPDSNYKLIQTDMYGSTAANGILVNVRGQLLGIIDQAYAPSDLRNLICGIGISEIRSIIENLSNKGVIMYVGIYGGDVPEKAVSEVNAPNGMFVKKTDMDSPAMKAGIQSGDILVSLDGNEIKGYQDYINAIGKLTTEEEIPITVMRQTAEGYTEIELSLTPGIRSGNVE